MKEFAPQSVRVDLMPIITAFATSPDRGRGLARDMTVRWALEEVGLAYDVELLTFAEMKQERYLAHQPFGQIPTYQEGDLRLFESGAIVLEIARKHPGLLPPGPNSQARAIAWMFAAQATVEPNITEFENACFFEQDRPWQQDHLALVECRLLKRLEQVADALANKEWLEGSFTAGDLMMVQVLRRIAGHAMLNSFPKLKSYMERAETRPAFERAYAAQAQIYRQMSRRT